MKKKMLLHARTIIARSRSKIGGGRCFRLALLLCTCSLRAAPETVIVPYDSSKPLRDQSPDQLYLPYERFLELWQRAKNHRAGVKPGAAPEAWALTSARYDGQVTERALTFHGTIDALTTNDAWVRIPLNFDGAKLSALLVDGVAAAYDGEGVLIEKPGRHRLEVTFEIPRRPNETTWIWRIPRTAATLVALTLPDARLGAQITPGSGVIERVADGVKIVTAAVGATNEVRVTLEAAAQAERIAAPASATAESQTLISAASESTQTKITFAFPQARQDHFVVSLENGLMLAEIGAENLKSWKLAPDDAGQRLELTLHEPVSDAFTAQITTQRALPPMPADLRAPEIIPDAGRVDRHIALLAAEAVRVTVPPDASLRQIPWDDREKIDGFRLVSAFTLLGKPPVYHAALAPPEQEARIDYVYQVDRRKIELIASLQLRAKGGPLFGVTLGLPTGFEAQAVECPRLQDWRREGGQLRIRFRDATPETTDLVVYLVRQFDAAPTNLDVRPLTLANFQNVTGEAVIAAHRGVEAAMTLSANAREIPPAQAAPDFRILPPLERKRGFSFKEQTFSAQIILSPAPAKYTALWVLHAQAHEGWISLSTRVRLILRQGAFDRATFSLPATLPEARVSGDEVRETRSRVEGERRIYEVQFQNDISEQLEFTIDAEAPNPGETPLPAIAFPEAQFINGFVLADNASEYELRLRSSGVDPALTSDIPWLPPLSKSAGVFRVRSSWSIVMDVARLEKVGGRAAFCAWAEFTTALRRNGAAWHRATWRLQNRSLQFLPVRLPAGAELMSARVAGQNVRADAGMVEGQAALLIPLIKTKPGDLSYDVEVVWRVAGEELGWRAHREFYDPELPGITVERTFWNLWLPDDRHLSRFRGNMEPVVEAVQKVEKLEGAVQELKSLVSVAASQSTSAQTRQSALANAQRLSKAIEEETRATASQDVEYQAKGQALKGGQIAEQRRYVDQKNFAVQNEWQQQAAQLEVFANQAPMEQAPALEQTITPGAQQQMVTRENEGIEGFSQGTQNGPADRRWLENRLYSVPATQVPVPALADQTGNFFINDNVVLQRPQFAQGKVPADPAAEVEKNLALENKGLKKSADDVQAGQGGGSAKGNVQLNTARGVQLNRGNEGEAQAQTQPPVNQPQSPASDDAEGGMGGRRAVPQSADAAAPQQRSEPGRPDAPPIPGFEPVFSVDASRPGSGLGREPFQERLQPEGRISLAVDFPTDGRVYHFKKVKAHANLDVTVTTPAAWTRWKWLALACALAALLAGLSRMMDRRAARMNTRAGSRPC